jgi:hypothetical protein
MRKRAISAREVLLAHPWAAALIESRVGGGTVRLTYADSVLGILRQAGFSPQFAYMAFVTLDSHIYGFTLQELSWPYDRVDVEAAIAGLRTPEMAARYPNVTSVMAVFLEKRAKTIAAAKPGRRSAAYDVEFAFGLDLILDGLQRALDAQRR